MNFYCKFLIVAAYCLVNLRAARAQDVSIKDDTVYVDGHAYCVLKSGRGLGKTFKVFSLRGNEALRVHYDRTTQEYLATFIPSLEEFMFDFHSLRFTKQLAEAVADAQLFVNDTLNPNAIAFMKKMYGKPEALVMRNKFSLQNISDAIDGFADGISGNGRRYALPERDKSAHLFFIGNTIKQDNVTIGSYEEHMKAEPGGLTYTYRFYTPNGDVAASAKVTEGKARITTVHNNGLYDVHVQSSNMLSLRNELTMWLVDHAYL